MKKIICDKRFNNMPLKQKLTVIIISGILIMAVIFLLTTRIMSDSYNKLLYQTMSESMSYSAKELTDYMGEMLDLTERFISDDDVQQLLTTLYKENKKGNVSLNALNRLGICLSDYGFTYSDGIMQYISLYTPVAPLRTNIIAVDKIPQKILDQILERSNEKDGAPCWIMDYMDEYGLMLARDIRQIEGLKLNTLGTMIINIDMDALTESCTRFEEEYGSSSYIIVKNEKILYHMSNLMEENINEIDLTGIAQYQILPVGDKNYFISHGIIPEYDWDYYCLVSYDQIKNKITGIYQVCTWIILLDLTTAIFLSTHFIRMLIAPISTLKERMQQFALDNTRIPQSKYDYSKRGDELGMLNRQFDEMSTTIVQLIRENYINELLKKEAQIKTLESQINPHFLYNTLDSIKWRAKSIGEKNISDMVDALGTLLRTSLNADEDENYTVGRELEVVFSYITIQKLRYENRLHFQNTITADEYTYIIPKLVIQPLIENAVCYGLEMNVDDCDISLSMEKKNGNLSFYIKNTGSSVEEDLIQKLERNEVKPHGHGVGLLNIHRRIQMQYGDTYGLELYNEEEQVIAKLTLPARKRENENAKINYCG